MCERMSVACRNDEGDVCAEVPGSALETVAVDLMAQGSDKVFPCAGRPPTQPTQDEHPGEVHADMCGRYISRQGSGPVRCQSSAAADGDAPMNPGATTRSGRGGGGGDAGPYSSHVDW